jgi:uncharacterized protein (TIGR00255 family)
MRSMTGFGLGDAPLGAASISAEVRSLNHRYLDVRVRVPTELAEHSFFVEQYARGRLERGRYDLSIRLEELRSAGATLDLAQARTAWAALCSLRDELAPGTELALTALSLVTSLNSPKPSHSHDDARASLTAAVDRALSQLDTMRAQEGTALLSLFDSHVVQLRSLLDQLQTVTAQAPLKLQRWLRERLTRLVTECGAQPERGRMETELALLADRVDVTEELSRLRCHVDQFDRLAHGEGPMGRQLDFLLQEMMREANTLGAKSHDAGQSHLSVDLKSEIERMREQIQNVE